MRFLLFVGAAAVLALGFTATRVLDHNSGFSFLLGSLQLGGGLAISGLFSLRWKWHGLLAGGAVALLGFARGLGNLPSLLKYLGGDRSENVRPVLESTATAICLILLISIVRALLEERRRKLLENVKSE
ncbi:MAG TPA: hypothetical protein VIM57_02215 [Luteolibacter sp.]